MLSGISHTQRVGSSRPSDLQDSGKDSRLSSFIHHHPYAQGKSHKPSITLLLSKPIVKKQFFLRLSSIKGLPQNSTHSLTHSPLGQSGHHQNSLSIPPSTHSAIEPTQSGLWALDERANLAKTTLNTALWPPEYVHSTTNHQLTPNLTSIHFPHLPHFPLTCSISPPELNKLSGKTSGTLAIASGST